MISRPCRIVLLTAALTLGVATLAAPAFASPWTLPKDKFVLSFDSNYQMADREYLPDGTLQSFPLQGKFSSITFGVGGRYGFTDKFEGAFDLSFKQVTFEADPVLLELPTDTSDNQAINEAIFNFGRAKAGAGDLRLHGRYNLMRGSVMLTSETSAKVPTGYDKPGGTFSADEPNPAAVQDDVALGDGQTDLTQSLLAGVYLPKTRSFGRLEAGYRLRFGSPGDQVVSSFSIGQYIGESMLLFGGASGAYTLFAGETVGQSFITRSPLKRAGELSPADIETAALTLDKDYLSVEGGVILKLRELELRASYGQILTGRNIPRIHSMSLGVVYALDDLTAE